jgi:hypothetical protein
MEARDRRPVRPTPGDRGSWSHGPIARVQSRAGGSQEPEPEPEPAPPAAPPASRYATAPAPTRRPPYPPYQPFRQPLPQAGRPLAPPTRGGFGLPSLRRNVCPHFYMTGSRGAIPIQAPHLLKGLLRQPSNVSRCQLRGGVHLDEGYVNDVCLTPRFNQCVFYEDELTKE